MFEKMRNIDRSFQQMRLFCIVLIVGCLATTIIIAVRSLRSVEAAKNTIYILAAGKAMEAFAGNVKDNIPVEARDHIRAFHEDLFTLTPNEKAIRARTTAAFYLADGSAKKFYDNLRESGYYADIIAGNVTQEIVIDTVELDTRLYPFHFRCRASLNIVRASTSATRHLITEGDLRRTERSDNDPHGFMIERWRVLEDKGPNENSTNN